METAIAGQITQDAKWMERKDSQIRIFDGIFFFSSY